MSAIVTVGRLSVEIFEGASIGPDARLTLDGPKPVTIDLSRGTGQRLFDELTRIRQALLAADAVLRDDQAPSGPVTKSEVHLARLLVELEVSP